ncbi:MAG: zf-HC2 domain-containing protein [Planctomycetota bacterium]
MRCRRVLKLLPLQVGGDLSPAEARAVEEHLSRCLGCFREARAYEASLKPVWDLAREAAPEAMVGHLAERVLQGAHSPGPRAPSMQQLNLHKTFVARAVAAAAAVLVIVVGTAFLGRPAAPVGGTAVPQRISLPESAWTVNGTVTGGTVSGDPVIDEGALGRDESLRERQRKSQPTWLVGDRSRDF